MCEENAADMLGSDQGQGGPWMLLDCWNSHVVLKPAFTGKDFSLTTAPLTQNTFWVWVRAHARTHTHTHTHIHTHTHTKCLSVFSRKGVTMSYTRNFLTQCSTSPTVFPDLVFICLGKTNSYNSFTL